MFQSAEIALAMRVYAKRVCYGGVCLVILLSSAFLLLPQAQYQPKVESLRNKTPGSTTPNPNLQIPATEERLEVKHSHLPVFLPPHPSLAQRKSSAAPPPLSAVNPGEELGYLIALSFNEQLESGMFDLHQLADLSNSWKLRVAEPYIHNTQFRFPNLPYKGKLLKLSNLYDIQDLNWNLRSSLNVSHDMVVPLNQVARWTGQGYQLVILQFVPYTISHESCNHSNITKYIHKLTAHLGCKGHECIEHASVACINTRERNDYRNLFKTHPVLRQALRQAQSSKKKLLVAIPVWNGIRPYRDRFFYWDPAFKTHEYYAHATAHSREVKSAARNFLDSLNLQQPTLGIHVRLERLLRAKPLNKTVIAACFSVELCNLIRSLQSNLSLQSAIMFRDYGRYGSSTCHKIQCGQFAAEVGLDTGMKALGVHVLEYRPQLGKVRREHGFSANVEQEVLSLTDYLITVGYGSFQKGVVERFKRHQASDERRHKRLFHICG